MSFFKVIYYFLAIIELINAKFVLIMITGNLIFALLFIDSLILYYCDYFTFYFDLAN